MAASIIDPLRDPRWAEFVERHPQASVFHTPGWLEALRRTYGYEPLAYTTTPRGVELANGIVFCRVSSRITGRRMVSLPFSDHCEPLVGRREDLEGLLQTVERDRAREGWNYVEIRPRTASAAPREGVEPVQRFAFHTIDLNPELEEIAGRFHADCIRRKIRRAEREGVTYEEGQTEAHLEKFYALLLRTCRRRQLPPQPREWFRNLVDCLGDRMKIRLASKDGRPIASTVTLSFRDVLVYKYGCSDERFHNLGGVHFVLWNAIQEGKKDGVREFDLGRSDLENPGLVAFKDRWGAIRSQLTYWRYPARSAPACLAGRRMQAAKKIFAHIPDRVLITAGQLLYRHIG